MNLPRKIKIGPCDWTVKVTRDLKNDEGTDCWGLCHPRTNEIEIDADHPNRKAQALTITHEILHALWTIAHLKAGDKEEKIVRNLSLWLCTVMRDNPELMRWMLAK